MLLIPGLFSLTVVAFYLVPDELIEGRIREAAVKKGGITFSQKSFQKAFPFGVELHSVEIAGNGAPLLLLDRVRARVNPLSVLAGRLTAYMDADAGDGTFTGYAIFRPSGFNLIVEAKGVDSRYLPLFARSGAGIDIKGLLDARVSVGKAGAGCAEGSLKMDVYRLERSAVKIMNFLPFDSIDRAGGRQLRGCKRG